MKTLLLIFIFIIFGTSWGQAEEFYRTRRPVYRLAGADQGNVGSCQSEGETAALESAFREKGYNVRLSSFYRNARIFQGRIAGDPKKKDQYLKDGMVRFNDDDLAILNKMGDVVPYYMLPDDTQGYRPRGTGIRPGIASIIAADPDFVATPLSYTLYTFSPGYTNTISSMDQIKALIKAGHAVALSFDPKFMMGDKFVNHVTGLVKKGVAIKDFEIGDPDHLTAIVGFDDSVYGGYGFSNPGALIIKNSWNNDDRRLEALGYRPLDETTVGDLKKMRYKLAADQNIPGYYAIPYDFITASVAAKKEINIVDLNFDFDGFAKQYAKLQSRYRVVLAPYICGPPLPNFDSRNSAAHHMIAEDSRLFVSLMQGQGNPQTANEKLNETLQTQLKPRGLSDRNHQFQYAYFSQNASRGIDRVRDFYSGTYNDYYCFPGNDGQFNRPEYLYPNVTFYDSSVFQQTLLQMTTDPGSPANWSAFLETLYLKEYSNETAVSLR